MNRKISLCIPQYKRSDLVMETITALLNDDRVDEIVLCDDFSPVTDYNRIIHLTSEMPKVKIYRNAFNAGNQHNKRNAISFAKNEFVVVVDNDNIVKSDFIDKLYNIPVWEKNIIYHPCFAAPNFDYNQLSGKTITKENVKSFCNISIFLTLLNTNNYFVNRDEYIDKYQYSKDVKGADGVFYSYNWLKEGNKIFVVPDMVYFHRVHADSYFLSESTENMKKISYWFEQVKQLN